MIWVITIGLCLAISAFLCAPLLARSVRPNETEEIETYRQEILAMKSRGETSDADRTQIAVLEARLLEAAKAEAPKRTKTSGVIPAAVSTALIGGTLSIYAMVGSPNFTPETFQTPPPPPANSDLNALLPRLEARLATTPEDPTGWYLYGRTLMLVDRYEEGLRAYERSLELNDNPNVRKEYQSAQTFAAQNQNGPNPEDITAAQAMSPEEQEAMILGMVSSLRERLNETPEDAASWTRLLRARKVLGQTEEAKADIETLRIALPDQAQTIISETGWSE